MEEEGRRAGSERCPGDADCQHRSSRGRRAPTCPTCGIGKVPGPARGDLRPAFSPENPQTSLPSPPPLKKPVKNKIKNPPPPHPPPSRGERRLGLAGVCSSLPARLRDPPADAGSSPVPGAAEPRTSVTWIFTRQEAATPAFPARSDWNPRRTVVRARTLIPAAPSLAFRRDPESPPEGNCFLALGGGCRRRAPEVDVTELRGAREL